ncbi:MAG: ATP-dependent DNA ligase, partial [Geminicoccaceae bacterium]
HRLMGAWEPSGDWFRALLDEHGAADDRSLPYPFFLASPLGESPDQLGVLDAWQVEWMWDGIRGQLIRREGEIFLWTRSEELVTDRYPELSAMAAGNLPDGSVVDGVILAWNENGVMPPAVLQERMGRSKVTKQVLKEAPVGFFAYDLLEEGCVDLRHLPLVERRRRLSNVVMDVGPPLMISATIEVENWEDLAAIREGARARRVGGLMLKRVTSAYGVGRTPSDWRKWKIDPFTIDAVLINAQAGSARRASLFSDYTFAIWKGAELVPIAKASSGLSEKEIATLDQWIRENTSERFGPVRAVEPHHVFEIAFEGGRASSRRKSGVALRSPHIVRWRTDKAPADADKIEQVMALLEIKGGQQGSKF